VSAPDQPGITFQIPPPADSPYLFRRAFLASIRQAIGAAQVAGELDTATAVECFKALPPADPNQHV
jgi:hypothetical protein